MKQAAFKLLIFASFLSASLAFSQTRNVTFVVNSATIPDTVGLTYNMQIRGNKPPLTWGNDTGGQLINIGGDYWSKTLAFHVGDTLLFKIFAGTNAWESDLTDPYGIGQGNHAYILAERDTTLAPQFFNSGAHGRPQYFRPWTAVPDSFINVYFRVNMHGADHVQRFGYRDSVDGDSVGVRGGGPSGGDLNWSPTFYLSKESAAVNGGFIYPAKFFKSARLRIPRNAVTEGQPIDYKFLIGYDWGRDELQGQPNRSLRIPMGKKDTTLQWVYFNNDREIGLRPDTLFVTWFVNMARSIAAGGFTVGDAAMVRYAFSPCPFAYPFEKQLLRMGLSTIYSASDTLFVPVGLRIYYRYCAIGSGQERCEHFFIDPGCEREVIVTSRRFAIIDTSNCPWVVGCMPILTNNRILARNVQVRWEVDLRPAWYQVAAGDTLQDIQGNFHITNRDSVMRSGVWMNGLATGSWQSWGIPLQQDTSRKMYDDGTHGDQVAGDSIFTRMILASPDSFGIGTKGQVGQVFKFSLKGGDNEGGRGGFGNNHQANINDSLSEYTMSEQWGSINPTFYRCWDYDNRRPLPCLTGVGELPKIPTAYELHQNYPNPFNPTTNIEYAIRTESFVTLKVYDVLGQKVATLVNERQKPAKYGATFDASKVASGIYFYRLTAGEFVSSRKMMVLK